MGLGGGICSGAHCGEHERDHDSGVNGKRCDKVSVAAEAGVQIRLNIRGICCRAPLALRSSARDAPQLLTCIHDNQRCCYGERAVQKQP